MTVSESNAIHILEALESEVAHIPGGRDREGRPLIAVNVPPGEPPPSVKSSLDSVLEYFLCIFSDEIKKVGFCLLIDIRSATWRVARSYIRLIMLLVGSRASSVIVIRPDGFWDKHVENCAKIHKDNEPTYIPIDRLKLYVEISQLPYDLGGNKAYDHSQWIQNRLRVEEFTNEAFELITRMTGLHERLTTLEGICSRKSKDNISSFWKMSTELSMVASRVLNSGRKLVNDMSRDSAQDILDTMQRIHRLLDSIELKQVEIENAWSEMERNLDAVKEIETLEAGVSRVTNWILGPADSMLNSRYQIGFDVSSSEELRREHEKLELECRETYGRYAELLHKIDSVPNGCLSEDLKSQRDFMDFVCRSFATRLERRRNVLITSQRFFRLVSEYFDKTSEVFDKLIMGNRTYNFVLAEIKLQKLEKSQKMLETLERELVKEGEKLMDILSMPVKDALCRDVQIDYGEDIVNVRDILDATNARKNIFNDSVELQKLTLKQIALIHSYESDAALAIKWLNDLFDVLLESHVEIGCNVTEIQTQKEEHQSFQETAKGTYEYGCQLITGACVLRISCKLPLDNNTCLSSMLRQAWKKLHAVGQEQLTRLRVCAVFHRSVEDHCDRLNKLIEVVKSSLSKRELKTDSDSWSEIEAQTKFEIRDVLAKREKLLPEVGRMVRLGRLLRTRLKEPLNHQKMSNGADKQSERNLSAVESISAKLLEVTRLAEKLDAKLFEAGARNRAAETLNETEEEKEEQIIEADRSSSPAHFLRSPKTTRDKKNENEEANEKSVIDGSVEDSNADEYVTATECSTTPMTRSRSESLLTSSEYEDAIGIPASTWQHFDSHITRSADCLFNVSNKNDIPINMSSTTINKHDGKNTNSIKKTDEVNTNNAILIRKSTEEKTGKIVKEVTETTTLRVSHDTRFGVASYKLISNTLCENHEHVDIKELQDLNRKIKNHENGRQTPSETCFESSNEIEILQEVPTNGVKYTNGQLFNSELKSPWSEHREEHSIHSTDRDSSGSSSLLNKYSRVNLRVIQKSSIIEEKGEINGTEENEDDLQTREQMVSHEDASENCELKATVSEACCADQRSFD